MNETLLIISLVLILLSILPFIQSAHWVFRVPEFLKLQLFILQLACFVFVFVFCPLEPLTWVIQGVQLALIAYHIYLLMRYSKFWRSHGKSSESGSPNVAPIKVISANIYQYNEQFDRFIQLIEDEQPDIFLTMESDQKWEKALRRLETHYPFQEKVTLDNTYGMHFYTKLKVINSTVHYFVADDLPSIEVTLETPEGEKFVFFGVHPPPPSPTEEDTSKERDGDLLSVAKKVRKYKDPVLVIGDFNNVAWAKTSILFRKTSNLLDARIGRGILSTFHSKYWFFRVPLDLLFHSAAIFIDHIKIYPDIGSDHFPIGCEFHIDQQSEHKQEKDVKDVDQEEKEEVDELIQEGKEENSENRE